MTSEIVLYQPDDTIQLEVRLQDETVWLSQQQMAELFGTDRTSILRHIHNVYKTHELEELATCAKIAQVRLEGNRQVMREIPIVQFGYGAYNLSHNNILVTGLITLGTGILIYKSPLLGNAAAMLIMNGEDKLTQISINKGYQYVKK